MKYSLVNGEKTEARPGLQGACAHCQSETIAKCGKVKIWHWAHKSKISCDPWWENETEWHRTWKNHFPTDWQEIIHKDSTTGEKHVADIKTDKEFIIEFQHSAIKPDEIKSREEFYKNMVWVVDGTRLSMDYPRFCKGFREFESRLRNTDFISSICNDVYFTYFPDECFPKRWLTSSVPVYFDFQGISPLDQPDEKRALLWGLLPGDVDGWSAVVKLRRKDFIENPLTTTAPHLLLGQDILTRMEQRKRQDRREAEIDALIAAQRVDPLELLRRRNIQRKLRRW